MSKSKFLAALVVSLFFAAASSAYADSWTPTGSLITARYDAAIVKLQNGKVLAVGGIDSSGHATASAELYDPATGVWSSTGSMSAPHGDGLISELLQDGRVLVVGGDVPGVGGVKTAELYDPNTGTWSQTGSMNTNHTGGNGVILADGKVLVADGLDASSQMLGTSELYDPATGVWTPSGSMQIPRDAGPMTLLQNGNVLMSAGYIWGASQSDSELYDPTSGTWTPTSPLNIRRSGHYAQLLQNGKVLIFGGNTDSNAGMQSSAELYDPATDTWSMTGSMSVPRESGASVVLPSGKVLTIDGWSGSSVMNSAETYDPATGIWSPAASPGYSLTDFNAVLLDNGQVLLAGGAGAAGGAVSGAELYSPDVSSSNATDCTGGTITHIGGNTIHTFTSSGTLDCVGSSIDTINVLVVGGGGGGGSGVGGGGGAGGFLTDASHSISASSYAVTVGAGGAPDQNGGDSSFDTMVAIGGGTGGTGDGVTEIPGASGGSGGGGAPIAGPGGAGTLGQGHAGGTGSSDPAGTYAEAAGGGGAGSVGQDGIHNTKGGDGGSGATSSISGVSVMYAGGGGGNSNGAGVGGTGQAGGGDGGQSGHFAGYAAAANSGSGGGGGNAPGYNPGGAGGSGIVIISYPTESPLPINHAPVLAPIGNQNVNEGATLSFTLSATDPDSGDILTYSASNLPSGATFDPNTRTFSWTPNYGQAGNYSDVEFVVTDNGSPMMLDLEDITITVGHVNRAPVISNPGPQQVLEHATLAFTVSATDPDGDAVTLSASGMPSGATFNPSTGVFSWTPGHPTAGVYTPTFKATDNGTPVASSSVDVVITVGSNPTPSEQDQTLISTVTSYNLPSNIQNQYLQNLNKVQSYIDQGKISKAINELNKFINKVNSDYAHGTITLAEKNSLVVQALALISSLQ